LPSEQLWHHWLIFSVEQGLRKKNNHYHMEHLKEDTQPGGKKDTLLFWKMLSFVLFVLLVISLLVSATK